MPVDYTNLPEPRDLFAVPSVVTIYRVSLPVFNINFLHSTKHQLNKHKPTDYIFPTNSPWTTLNGSLKTWLREIILNFLLLWWQSREKNLGKWAKLKEWNGHKGGLSQSITIYIHNWQTRHFFTIMSIIFWVLQQVYRENVGTLYSAWSVLIRSRVNN